MKKTSTPLAQPVTGGIFLAVLLVLLGINHYWATSHTGRLPVGSGNTNWKTVKTDDHQTVF